MNPQESDTPPGAVAVRTEPATQIVDILRIAIEGKVDVGTIERLVALKERSDAKFAATEMNLALAAFQSECPPIQKKSTAKITTKSGGQYAYKYAELDQIARVTRPLLTKHGLSYSWDSSLENDRISCTCTLRHVGGHFQTASFATSTKTESAMNDQQKVAAALTYARRQSLIQVLGLTTTDPDTDGGSTEKITEQQAMTVNDLVVDSGADLTKFLAYMGVASIAEISARDFHKAMTALKAKKKGGAP